jgi:branched-chain amino acid transport system substrate-binding protein
LVYEDTSGLPEKAAAGAKRLILDEGVVYICGEPQSSVVLAIQDVCEQYGVPFVPGAASNGQITAKHLNTTFRIHPIDPQKAEFWMDYLKLKGYKKVGMMIENTDFGIGLANYTKQARDKLYPTLEIKDLVFDKEAMDYSSFLLALDAWGPDIIIDTGAVVTTIARTLSQAYDLGIYPRIPILSASQDPSLYVNFWNSVHEKGLYYMFMSYYHVTLNMTQFGKNIQEAYWIQYGEEPGYPMMIGYSAIQLCVDAIRLAGSAERSDIVNALRTGTFSSWWMTESGTFKFTEGEGVFWHQASPRS